jgi:DNA polymerase III sliding clamp (beta) subunit (PCNA family)
VFELKKILETIEQEPIFLGVCNNQLVFSGQSFNFFSKLLANQFPEYAPILQKEGFVPATIDRQHLVKTLRRATSLLSGNFIATQFSFGQESVQVQMHNKEVGKLKEALPVNGFKGAQLDIRFYAPYLLNGLQAFSDEQVTFYLKTATRPIMFKAERDGYQVTYLVMPVSPSHGV